MQQESHDELMSKLSSLSLEATSRSLKVVTLTMSAMEYSLYLGDIGGGFFDKIGAGVEAISVRNGRTKSTKKLNEVRDSTEQYISAKLNIFNEVNDILNKKNISLINFENPLDFWDYHLDNAADNEEWFDEYSAYVDSIINALDLLSSTCEKSIDLLEKIGFRRAAPKA